MDDLIRFLCPNARKTLKAPSTAVGRGGAHPACGAKVAVPNTAVVRPEPDKRDVGQPRPSNRPVIGGLTAVACCSFWRVVQ